MEETSKPIQEETTKSSFMIPPHSNKMVFAILVTLFCCLIGGIVSIVYSSKSNSLYNQAIITNDDSLKQNLYMQSEQQNKNANIWLIVSAIIGAPTRIFTMFKLFALIFINSMAMYS